MNIHLSLEGKTYALSLPGIDISIPLHFNGPQPNTYGVEQAKSAAYRSGPWVGDVREGGSCNFETVTLTPHCNGTHTECIGHITAERHAIVEKLKDAWIPCTVLSVLPVPASQTEDQYEPALAADDLVIGKAQLMEALPLVGTAFHQAMVIRTLPNDRDKQERDYMKKTPAFFTLDAMQYLLDIGMEHLLTDLPSVDRLFDEGKLRAHHVFWKIEAGSSATNADSRMFATITEMIFVPDEVEDGAYLLNLQIAPFMSDAAPSRPLLFPLSLM